MVNMGELFAYSRIGDDTKMERVPLSDSEAERFLLQPGDLLFARQSLVASGAGKCVLFQGATEPVTFESHIIRVRLNPAEADSRFYFYFFNSPSGRRLIETIIEQVAAAGVRGSDLADLAVPCPALDYQRRMADALSNLDNLADLNEQVSKSMFAIAESLFRYLFIDFGPIEDAVDEVPSPLTERWLSLYPSEFTDSPLGPAPKGWTVSKMQDHVRVTRGCSYRSAELREVSDSALLGLKAIPRGGGFAPSGLKPYDGTHKPDQVVHSGELVVAHTDLTQAADVIGKPALIHNAHPYSKLVASLDVAIVRPTTDAVSVPFLYFLFVAQDFQDHAYGYANGSTVLHLDKRAVPEYEFALPPKPLMQAFTAQAESLLAGAHQRVEMNVVLRRVRDALLPALTQPALGARVVEAAREVAVQ
jgi:type I restriction enzyme S subunit